MLNVLEERKFPVHQLIPVASERSAGKKVTFKKREYTVVTPEDALLQKPRIALFSAGATLSRQLAPRFAESGCFVIDNSSAWRMESGIPLVVPEINGNILTARDKLIANPNCSTIQMVMVLAPLHQKFGIKRVIVSTYQSVTGTGKAAMDQLFAEREGKAVDPVYPHPIDLNCLPHCDVFLDNGYTREEMKLVEETRKILQEPKIKISATAVRVPVTGGHSEAVNIRLRKGFDLEEVIQILETTPGIIVQDSPGDNLYPMPVTAKDHDEVFVGRIRRDISSKKSLNLWIVADNLRKGAATNAVQIAELLVSRNLV